MWEQIIIESSKFYVELTKSKSARIDVIKICGYTLISLITVEVGINVEGVQKLQNQ